MLTLADVPDIPITKFFAENRLAHSMFPYSQP